MATYKSTVDWLNVHHPFLVTPLINLGKPVFNVEIPTAQVEKNADSDVELSINPKFFEQHSEQECAGVLTHELYHIVMNHLAEFNKFDNEQARIIAQECIVNDSVLEEGMVLPDIGLCYGQDWVQYNASFLPTKIVYDDLMKDPDKLPQEVKVSCSHKDKGLDPREIFSKVFQGADLDEASESMKVILEDAASKAGTGFSLGTAKSGKQINLKWVELINRMHPDTFTGGGKSKTTSTWARPRRKLAGLPERIMLPDRRDSKKYGLGGNNRPKVILALDTSLSIPREKVDELMALANSIPKNKVDVACCTFSTYHKELDISKEVTGQAIANGGTDFNAVQKFVSEQKSTKNLHVIVITDGFAAFRYGGGRVPETLDTHWHWLVFRQKRTSDDRISKNIYLYEDYIG